MADSDHPPGDVTLLLRRWSGGDRGALDALMPIVYQELRKLAQSYFRNERTDHTLQATALVNEAFLRLTKDEAREVTNRAHFFAVAAQAMRRILIDHARQARAAKRGGGETLLSFEEAKGTPRDNEAVDILALDILLRQLSVIDERQAQVVEMRYFGGLSIEETAEVMEISPATVKREWNMAKAWLRRELSR